MIRFSKTSPGIVRLDVADGLRIAAVQPDAQIDDAVGAEGHDRLAGLRVDFLQEAVHRENQALIAAVGALPVVHAARGHPGHVFVHPQLSPGLRVDRHQRAIAAATVDDAAHGNWTAAGLAERIGPRHLQVADVATCDLLDGNNASCPDRSLPGPPLVALGLRGCGGEGSREGGEAGERQQVSH